MPDEIRLQLLFFRVYLRIPEPYNNASYVRYYHVIFVFLGPFREDIFCAKTLDFSYLFVPRHRRNVYMRANDGSLPGNTRLFIAEALLQYAVFEKDARR